MGEIQEQMTLEAYIEYRTGAKEVPKMIKNMLLKPFMASSLRSFWQYWNPGYGYFLLFFCYKPLRKVFPDWSALLITFMVCGLLHDVIYIIPMMLQNGGNIPIPFVTVWFVLISFGIFMTDAFKLNFRKIAPQIRPLFHIGFLGSTFYATRLIDLMIWS